MFQEAALTPASDTEQLGPDLSPASNPEQLGPNFPQPQISLLQNSTEIRHQLLCNLRNLCPGLGLKHLITQCLDIFMQFAFPQAPIVHEPTLRASVYLLDTDLEWPPTSPVSLKEAADHERDTQRHDLDRARSIILLTAVCSISIAHNPKIFGQEAPRLTRAFLDASRSLLTLYHDRDVENPDSSSIVFRMFHSAAIHSVGATRLSWIVQGEAIRLVQDMKLYLEASLVGLEPLEAQLRRNVCCLLYTADRSAAILNNRPSTLGELCLEIPPSPSHGTWDDTPLMDIDKPYNTRQFEHCIAIGFGMCQDIWNSASNILLELRLVQRRLAQDSHEGCSDSQASVIIKGYLEFMSILDDPPPWFHNPDLGASQESAKPTNEITRYQSQCFWVQRVNIQVTFHCLRLIILQKAVDCNSSSLLGVSDQPLLLAFKKTEIAQDILKVIQHAPFEALRTNGEPCVLLPLASNEHFTITNTC